MAAGVASKRLASPAVNREVLTRCELHRHSAQLCMRLAPAIFPIRRPCIVSPVIKPRDILLNALDANVVARLADHGFSFGRSQLTFKRSHAEFRHQIQFSLSKWNQDGSCEFWSTWAVTSPAYSKWHMDQWAAKPPSDTIAGLADWNIPGWSRGTEHFHLNGGSSDDAEIGVWLRDAEETGLPYLAAMSSWTADADQLLANKWHFHRAADFLMIAGDRERARDALLEGVRIYESGERVEQMGDLDRIKARIGRYFSEP